MWPHRLSAVSVLLERVLLFFRNKSKQGIVFVRASRVNQGIVFDDAVFDPQHYCISANTLSAQKARVLLMLALSQTQDREVIREIFNEY